MRGSMVILAFFGLLTLAPGCESDKGNDGTGVLDGAGSGADGQGQDAATGGDTAADTTGAVDADGDTAGATDSATVEDMGATEDGTASVDTVAVDAAAPVDTATVEDTATPVDTIAVEDTTKPTYEIGPDGCLTYAGASALCGGKSDKSVCALAATCRPDGDQGQCSIDCEMSPSVGCLDQAAVDCVLDAATDGDCEGLAACAGWYLVY